MAESRGGDPTWQQCQIVVTSGLQHGDGRRHSYSARASVDGAPVVAELHCDASALRTTSGRARAAWVCALSRSGSGSGDRLSGDDGGRRSLRRDGSGGRRSRRVDRAFSVAHAESGVLAGAASDEDLGTCVADALLHGGLERGRLQR